MRPEQQWRGQIAQEVFQKFKDTYRAWPGSIPESFGTVRVFALSFRSHRLGELVEVVKQPFALREQLHRLGCIFP